MWKPLGCYFGRHTWSRLPGPMGEFGEGCLDCGALRSAPELLNARPLLIEVEDKEVRSQLLARLDSIVAVEPDFRWRITLKDAAVVVPIPGGSHFDMHEAEAVRGLVERDEASLYLVNLEERADARKVFFVTPTTDQPSGTLDYGFWEINTQWGLFEVAVLPDAGEWLVLCSGAGDFLLAIGAPDDVDEIVGQNRDEALEEFADYARSLATHPMPRLHGAGEIDWRDIPGEFVV
jgi:hypothetical protein